MKYAAIITVIYLLLGLLGMFWENHLLFVGVSSVLIFMLTYYFFSKINSNQKEAVEKLTDALEESEKKFKKYLERIVSGYVTFDNEWRFVFVNKKAAAVWSSKPEDLIGKVFWEEFPEAIGGEFYKGLHEAQKTGQFTYQEEYYEPWDTWFADFMYPDEDGVSVFFHDITRQKKAEQQVKMELREKNALINSTKDMIWSVDRNLNLRSCNAVFMKNIESFTGKKLNPGDNVLIPEYGEEIVISWTQYYKEVFAGNSIDKISVREFNGNAYYSNISLYPIYDQDEIVGASCYSQDITQKEEALLALKASEKKYRQNLERISSAYAAFDNDWCFTYVNQKAAKVWEKEPDHLVGKTAWDVFPQWLGTDFHTALLEAKEAGQFVYNETYFEPWNVWFANFIYPDKEGVSVFFHDISRQKRAEAQLKHGLMEKNALINSTDDLIWSMGAEMKLRSWNQAFMKRATLVMGRRMAPGEPVTLVEFGEEIALTWKILFDRAMEGEIIRKTQRLELNGEASYEEFSLHPIYDEDKVVGVTCFSKNVTMETLAIEGLRESENKYRTLLERITSAMVSFDNDWNYTYVNARAGEFLGKDPEYLLGKNVWEVFPEGVGQPFYEALYKAKESQQFIYLELHYEPWDTWYEDYIYPSPEGISVFYNDITARKKAEGKLREQESLLSKVFDSTVDAMGLAEVTDEGEFIFVFANRKAEEFFQIFGIPKEYYFGKELKQAHQAIFRSTKEEVLLLERQFKELVASHKTVIRESSFQMANNEEFTFETRFNPVIDETGKCTHVLWLLRDMTQQKANERAIAESREQLNLIYQSTTEMMALLSCGPDRRCFIQSANPPFMDMLRQSISGAKEAEIKGTPLEEFLRDSILVDGPENFRKAIRRIYRAAEQKEPEKFPMSNLVDGKVRDFELSVIPILDDSGSTKHLLLVIYDQTERLYETEKTFMAITSAVEEEQARLASELHDSLTQTLSVASINLKNLSHDFAEIKDQKKYARALQYLEEGIEESRSIAHRIMPKAIKDFGLIPSVKELIENLGVEKPVITFSYNLMIRLPEEFELNLFRIIQQALSNTLSYASANSFDAALMIEPAYIQLQIKDDGVGFDLEAISGSHDGIGIRTMRARTAQLGGFFKLESQTNEGTIISIKIPVKIKLPENEK